MLTAIYARVSSEKQEEQRTIESQVAELRKAATGRGLTVFQEYIDDGYSGEMMNRPALDQLRDDAGAKKFQHVLIYDPDRLARKTIYAGIIMEELRRHSIKVEFLTMKNDDTNEGRFMFGIISQFAEYEKAKFMERSRRGKMHKAGKGELMISWAPTGYTYIPKTQTENGYLVINEREAEAVRLIFSLCVDRMLSATKILQELTRRNIPAPGRNGGRVWHRSVIIRILHNETYAGVWHYNKNHGTEPKYHRGVKPMKAARRLRTSSTKNPKSQWVSLTGKSIPAIVDRETYDRAQEQLVRNRSFSKRNARREYLLKSLLRCGVCQYRYCGNGRVYRCGGAMLHTGNGQVCQSSGISVPVLDASVWKGLKNALADPRVLMDYLDDIVKARHKGLDRSGITRDGIESEIAKIKAAEGRLLDAFTNGVISRDQLEAQMRKLKARKDRLPIASDAVPIIVESREKFFDYCRKLRGGFDAWEDNFEKKRNLVRLLVREVTINTNRQLVIQGQLPDGEIVTSLRSQRGLNNKATVPFQIQVKLAAA